MPSKRRTLFLLGGLLCGLAFSLPAAANAAARSDRAFVIDVWDTDEGLPQSTVTSILQTRDGYLWLGTLNGLVRFDGVRFTVLDENNTPGLESGRIVRLFEDRQRTLWIGTETAGVALFKDGRTSSLGIGQGASDRRLTGICEDTNGAVWLYMADGQLWQADHGRLTPYLFGHDRPSASRILLAEPDGPVWVGTDGRQAAIGSGQALAPLELPVAEDLPMRQLDYLLASKGGGYWRLADGRIQKCRRQRVETDLGPYPWVRGPVTAACEDRQGNLVVGTRGGGLYWFAADGQVTWLSTRQGLSHDGILSLFADRDGSLWVGTAGGGLNRVKRQVFEVLDQPAGLAANTVQSVCADDQGGLWIGANGGGVTYWKEGVRQRFGPNQGLTNMQVSAVFVDRRQAVWAGTRGGGLFRLEGGQFRRPIGTEAMPAVIFALYEDRRGRLWVGTQSGLMGFETNAWKLFTTRNGLPADEVRAVVDDAEGNLWIGTMGGGLCRYREGVFASFHKKDGLPSEDVASLYVDREGVLWLGTFGGGLGRFHQGRWTRYTTRDGLLSNSLGYLLEDDRGWLWLGSSAGLLRVQKAELNRFAAGATPVIACRAYGKPDGLPTRECAWGSQPGAGRDRQGRLWFPTVKGLVSLLPDQLNPNPNPPPVIIESLLLDGQPYFTNAFSADWSQPVTVPASKQRVEIHYTCLNLAAPDKARFKHRLAGYENDWLESGNSRVVSYSKLPPGRYRFQVTACNEDGVWNETGRELALNVEPPFWRTWWFLCTAVPILLGTVVAVVYYLATQKLQRQLARLKQAEALEKDRARIAQDIHDQLGASLTQVALLGELVEGDKDQPAEVEAHARQISQTARETTRILDQIVWAVNPANDTLEGLITYACKHAQEYLAVAGVQYRLEAPEQLPNVTLPPELRHNVFLAFKEAVTNIVRHAGASAVQVRLHLTPDHFALEIEDNGRGMGAMDPKAARARNGLRGMRQRLESVGGVCTIEPAPSGGTRVRLQAPLTPRHGAS